jgi:hypothetical protein
MTRLSASQLPPGAAVSDAGDGASARGTPRAGTLPGSVAASDPAAAAATGAAPLRRGGTAGAAGQTHPPAHPPPDEAARSGGQHGGGRAGGGLGTRARGAVLAPGRLSVSDQGRAASSESLAGGSEQGEHSEHSGALAGAVEGGAELMPLSAAALEAKVRQIAFTNLKVLSMSARLVSAGCSWRARDASGAVSLHGRLSLHAC